MRDSGKMAELKFEAPLAQFEETDEWSVMDFHNHQGNKTSTDDLDEELRRIDNADDDTRNRNIKNEDNTGLLVDNAVPATCVHLGKNTNDTTASASSVADNFTETFSGSLEDLVNTFDDKITRCFCNYDESVDKIAPVQVRTQEDIMNECHSDEPKMSNTTEDLKAKESIRKRRRRPKHYSPSQLRRKEEFESRTNKKVMADIHEELRARLLFGTREEDVLARTQALKDPELCL